MLLKFAECFGRAVGDTSPSADDCRRRKHCPFRDAPCNKGNLADPLGVCSLTDSDRATVVCPSRFLEGGRLFEDAGRIAFGERAKLAAIPEIRVLRVETPEGRQKKIGKIDFMLAALDQRGHPIDFAALEVQSVYISGKSIKPAFHHFLKTGEVGPESARRPDFRSSAQKRLMPQLSLKVPVFRRWGKKFFVAVDRSFFQAMPPIRTVDSIENSEVTWLIYDFKKRQGRFQMGKPEIAYTVWDEVMAALREGAAPRPSEMLEELRSNLGRAAFRSAL